jgi:hypothetical protein
MSYFVQGKYAYDNRYYVTVNFRSDGNSDFGEYQKWGNFSSAGVGWNIHNEHFVTLLELLQVLVLIPYIPSLCPNIKSLLKQLQQEIALHSVDYLA